MILVGNKSITYYHWKFFCPCRDLNFGPLEYQPMRYQLSYPGLDTSKLFDFLWIWIYWVEVFYKSRQLSYFNWHWQSLSFIWMQFYTFNWNCQSLPFEKKICLSSECNFWFRLNIQNSSTRKEKEKEWSKNYSSCMV